MRSLLSNISKSKVARIIASALVLAGAIFGMQAVPAKAQVAGNMGLTKLVRNITQGQGGFVSSISANPNDQVEFQVIILANGGPVSNIVFTDTMQSGLNYTSNSFIVDGALAGNNLNSVNLGSLNSGQSKILFIRATVSDPSQFSNLNTPIQNTGFASSLSNSSQSTAQVNIIQNPASVFLIVRQMVKNVTQSSGFVKTVPANPADQVQFQIQVTVNGNGIAQNVTINDALPNNFSLTSGATTLNLGNMNPGSTQTFTLSGILASDNNFACGFSNLTNNVSASASNANIVFDSATVNVNRTNCNNVNLILSQRAYNQTQNVDATAVVARPGDIIIYTLSVRNQGNAAATNFVFQDDLSDVLQLSQLQSFGGATFNLAPLTLTWPQTTIAAGANVEKTFIVKVNATFPAGSDNIMSNVFGNTVNVRVDKPAVLGAFVAPKTGSTTTMALVLALTSVLSWAGYKYFKKFSW